MRLGLCLAQGVAKQALNIKKAIIANPLKLTHMTGEEQDQSVSQKEIMPTVIEPIERWNPEIEKYLEHKFDCYYQYEGAKVVTENVYVRIAVIHKYTRYTVGKVIKFHRKSTLTPVLDKLLSEHQL